MGVKYNPRELQELEHLDEDPDVVELLLDIGDEIVTRARQLCPRDTGELARSIHAELGRDPIIGLQVLVGWDDDHFYGWFVEAGTASGGPGGHGQPARPFLRPAAAPYIDRPST